MTIKKTYPKSKNICRVTFRYPDDSAQKVCLVGDFNEWDKSAMPMKKTKGVFSKTLELEPGREYQFRYLVDDQEWVNDDSADHYNATPFHDAENSVVVV